jgi:signal transduction histidine kinase
LTVGGTSIDMQILPLPVNETERLASLSTYQIMDTDEEQDYDAITSLASVICQIPIALITFIDQNRQYFKSHHGTPHTENLREYSFCTHAIASDDEIMVVPDASRDARFAENPMVTGPTKVVFYAGVPLINEEGFALGTLCVLDQQTHVLSNDQIQALKTLAHQVVDKLELRRKVRALERTNQELLNANLLIQKFASMAAHDIKNPLSSVLLTSQALQIRLQKLSDEGCLRLVNLNILSTRKLLNMVDEMLDYSKNPTLLLTRKTEFDLNQVLSKMIGLLTVPKTFTINLPEPGHQICISVIAFEQIMMNLLSNAIRYNNKPEGYVSIRLKEDATFYHFEVEDNGMGIAEQYHERIFTDRFTLKITDRYNKKGTGIGLSTVKELITALNGNIYVRSAPDEGATFFLSIKK